eukprot:5921392-Ditylum_brightwellii.AAC.1
MKQEPPLVNSLWYLMALKNFNHVLIRVWGAQDAEWTTGNLGLNLPGAWIIHCTHSAGYMHREKLFKTIDNFTILIGASEENLQLLFQDDHDAHWDTDALDMLQKGM